MGASPGITGTARGQSQLRQAFEFTNSYAMPQPELLVFRAHEKFDAQGRLTDEPTRQFLAISRCTGRMDDAVQDRARLRRREPIRP
jgi:NAD(P)H-dependent FMN reductase